jgi:hypothetical protein
MTRQALEFTQQTAPRSFAEHLSPEPGCRTLLVLGGCGFSPTNPPNPPFDSLRALHLEGENS